MPYKNIVFVKLEKRIFNDPRWYMMSEKSQLNFIRLILFAAETYNKIPKNITALKKAFKTEQEESELASSIKEIQASFPKFRENKHYYYFEGFDEKTNYRNPKEIPRKSQGVAKVGADKDKDKEKEEDKEKEKDKRKSFDDFFERLWKEYPSKDGKKEAFRHFRASVKTEGDLEAIGKALQNYLASERVKKGYVKNGSTWFNNWQDWIQPEIKVKSEAKRCVYDKGMVCNEDCPRCDYARKE